MSKMPKKFGKNEKDFSTKILKVLSQNANKPFNYKQISALLEVDDTKSRNEIIKDLKILASQKKIVETEPGKYLVKAISQDYYEGKIELCASGFHFCKSLGNVYNYYDFGDGWETTIKLLRIDKNVVDVIPKCIAAIGDAPPEDAGGPYGFAEIQNIISDPRHEEYEQTLGWLESMRWKPLDMNNIQRMLDLYFK